MKADDKDNEDKKIATAKINTQLGMAYLERQEVQRAKQKLLIALDEAPTIPETWYSMAYFLESTGNNEEAGKYYLKAVELAPKRGDVQNNYGTYLCRKGEYKNSIQHFLLATKDPEYLDIGSAYENAGLCAMKSSNKKLATHYFTLALMQDPNRPVSTAQLAKLKSQEVA